MGLAIFGSSSENLTRNETQNVSGGADNGAFNLSASSSDVTVTDGGAIEKMAEITLGVIQRQGQAEQAALQFAADAGRPDAQLLARQTTIMMLGIAAVVLFMNMPKGKRRR